MQEVKHTIKELIPREDHRGLDFMKGKEWIVEFVGPTGSGKTTNCRSFTDLLRSAGLNVYEFKDVKDHLYQLGFLRRLNIYTSTFTSNGYNFLSYVALLVANGIYSPDSIYRYIKLCVFNAAVREFMTNRKVDLLLLDQWIIQGLWSATIFRTNDYRGLQAKLKKFYFKTHCVLYFDVDEETASERIRLRREGRSRFDSMDSERRLSELRRYNKYLTGLYENSDCRYKFKFSTRRSPAANANLFYEHLEKLLKGGQQSA